MQKIGLDFGTTNSILSFLNSENSRIECYKMGGESGTMYIPSYVSFEKEDSRNSLEVGNSARLNLGDEDYEVFSRFKMLLGINNEEKLAKNGFSSMPPAEITKSFLEKLIQGFLTEHNLKGKIQSMVITVPEIWIKEGNHLAREELMRICAQLDLPVKKFLSEPVAAGAYFVDLYHQEKKEWFNGHILVCDYGGGTLDLSLTEAREDKITVLECTGKGYDTDSLGQAGVAFDEAVIRRVLERNGNGELSGGDAEFYKLLRVFEELKIVQREKVDKGLERYLRTKKKNRTLDKKLFRIEKMEVMPSDLVESFNSVIKPVLLEALREMKQYFPEHDVHSEDKEKFQLVMAGGFSNFYLVRRTVMEFFDTEVWVGFDERSNLRFNLYDTALAISKGAALVANKIVDIDPMCPISMGLQMLSDRNGEGVLKKTDFPILKKGVKISRYKKPAFIDGIKVNLDPRSGGAPVVIFLGDNDNRHYIKLEKAVKQLFPNIGKKGNTWKVGFSVDEDLLFYLHVHDAKNAKKVTPLGDLLEKISGLVYSGAR